MPNSISRDCKAEIKSSYDNPNDINSSIFVETEIHAKTGHTGGFSLH